MQEAFLGISCEHNRLRAAIARTNGCEPITGPQGGNFPIGNDTDLTSAIFAALRSCFLTVKEQFHRSVSFVILALPENTSVQTRAAFYCALRRSGVSRIRFISPTEAIAAWLYYQRPRDSVFAVVKASRDGSELGLFDAEDEVLETLALSRLTDQTSSLPQIGLQLQSVCLCGDEQYIPAGAGSALSAAFAGLPRIQTDDCVAEGAGIIASKVQFGSGILSLLAFRPGIGILNNRGELVEILPPGSTTPAMRSITLDPVDYASDEAIFVLFSDQGDSESVRLMLRGLDGIATASASIDTDKVLILSIKDKSGKECRINTNEATWERSLLSDRSAADTEHIEDLIQIADDIYSGIALMEKAGDLGNLSGLRYLLAGVDEKLVRYGVTPMDAMGQPFSPQLHNAIAHETSNARTYTRVTQVHRRGYLRNGNVYRCADVTVLN